MKRARITVVVVALLVAVAGVLISPARNTLAAHEGTCYNAFLSGNYNLIIGAGEIDSPNGIDLIVGSAGDDEIDGGNCDDIVCGGIGNKALVRDNPGGDGNEFDLCDGESGTDTATRCDTTIEVP